MLARETSFRSRMARRNTSTRSSAYADAVAMPPSPMNVVCPSCGAQQAKPAPQPAAVLRIPKKKTVKTRAAGIQEVDAEMRTVHKRWKGGPGVQALDSVSLVESCLALMHFPSLLTIYMLLTAAVSDVFKCSTWVTGKISATIQRQAPCLMGWSHDVMEYPPPFQAHLVLDFLIAKLTELIRGAKSFRFKDGLPLAAQDIKHVMLM